MKHLDLFSGIGGFTLACQWAGIETIGFVEIDKYCQKVLRKHWPNVPIVEDIRDVEKIKEIVANATGEGLSNWRGASLANAGAEKPESKRCDSTRSRLQDNAGAGVADRDKPAILVTAGFPCQPFSVAGKRQGERDDRYLWPETLAVIEAIKPKWVLLENVTGIKSVYQPDMLSELEGREYLTEEEAAVDLNGILEREATNTLWLVLEGLRGAGYEVEILVIPACAVNAWHRRDRIWVVAHAKGNGNGRGPQEIRRPKCGQGLSLLPESDKSGDVCHSSSNGLNDGQARERTEPRNQRSSERQDEVRQSQGASSLRRVDAITEGNGIQGRRPIIDSPGSGDRWAVEPKLGGMVDGLSHFVDGYFDTEPDIPRVTTGIKNRKERIRALGNAIVPQVAYEIIKVIKEIEER